MGRCSDVMQCRHHGFHSTTSSYDRGMKVLTYFRCCDECGARLTEVSRLEYEPRFDPAGNDPYLPMGDPPLAEAVRAEH
jgi:hypothetical protein